MLIMGSVEHRAGTTLRWSRAGLLTSVAMSSGVVAHESAGGLLPGPATFVVLFLVCLATNAALLGRRASTLRVVVLVMAGQTFIHGALTAISGHRGDPPARRAVAVPQVAHASASVQQSTGQGRRGSYFDLAYAQQHPGAGHVELVLPAPVQHLMVDLTGPHAAMALAHLAAAAVVGLWLAFGERALWTVLAVVADGTRFLVAAAAESYAVVLSVLAGVSAAGASLRGSTPHLDSSRIPRPGQVRERVASRRGPPVLLAP